MKPSVYRETLEGRQATADMINTISKTINEKLAERDILNASSHFAKQNRIDCEIAGLREFVAILNSMLTTNTVMGSEG